MCNEIEVIRNYIVLSIYKYIAATILMTESSNMGSFQYIWLNYFNSVESIFLIASSAPSSKLTHHYPNDNLFSIENAFTMFG